MPSKQPKSYQLMAHQTEGVQFLLSKKSGIIAFEQGLGKTLLVIDAFVHLLEAQSVDCILIVCPNTLRSNWIKELETFAPEVSAEVIGGNRKQRRIQFAVTKADAVVVNYETFRVEVPSVVRFLERRNAVVVFDESHATKNQSALTSIAAQYICPSSPYRWLLSGTPVTNSPSDLVSQLKLVVRNGDSELDAFNRADFSDATVLEELRKLSQPWILRKTKEECLKLPEKQIHDLLVSMPPWQKDLYNEIANGARSEAAGMTDEEFKTWIPNALARLTRLAQVASNPALLYETERRLPGKFIEIRRIVEEETKVGGKVLIWTNFTGTISRLLEFLAEFRPEAIYGGVPPEERQGIVNRFQSQAMPQVLVLNPAAAATGLTLTRAAVTIYESLGWRYDYHAQSQDRNHRIGQESVVKYYRLICENTLDTSMAKALKRKEKVASCILGDPSSGVEVGLTRESFIRLLDVSTDE